MFARVRVSAAHAHELAAVVVAAAVAVWSAGGDFVGGRVETSRRVHDAQLHDATAGRSRPLAPLHPHPDAGGGCASRARGRRRRGDGRPLPRRRRREIWPRSHRGYPRAARVTPQTSARVRAPVGGIPRGETESGAPRARRARGGRIGTRRGRIGDFAGAAGVVAGSPTQTRAASNAGGVAARSRAYVSDAHAMFCED